ncbi:hypothetical protein GGR51DRAFT_21565 [Nemania sp. FL0031]|nr:hypothetical protein GGR51DRAFT_21565 [Nemania sp. FL0031]
MSDNIWLEFRLLSDGLEADAVMTLPLTVWNERHNPIFHLFSSLPPELRLKVWNYLIVPRIVGIACLYDETQRDEVWAPHSAIRPSIPVLLHVNQETRALALEHYELSFSWSRPQQSDIRAWNPPGLLPLSIAALPMSFFAAQAAVDRRSSPAPTRPSSSPPRTWFNFALDAVYLVGDLEPCDMGGINRPMPYFLEARTARRVRKTAVSFGALRYRGTGPQQIFGALAHVVDRFRPEDREVLVCVTERDEFTHALMGHKTGLVDECYRHRGAMRRLNADADAEARPTYNVLQNIWRDWYFLTNHTPFVANMRFPLIPENDLAYHVHEFMTATPVKRARKEEGSTVESSKQ